MRSKWSRFVFTLKANPWLVIQREIRTPDRSDLVFAYPRSAQSLEPAGGRPIVGAHPDHHLFDVANVAVHVAPIGTQVEDGIADNLPKSVIRDVAAAPCLCDVDAELCQPRRRGDDIRTSPVALDAKRDDGRVLQQKEQVGHVIRSPLLDKGPLEGEGVPIVDDTQPPDLERAH